MKKIVVSLVLFLFLLQNLQAEGKRIVVVGGAGFIGVNLCLKLLQMGDEVICVDNLWTGNKKRLEELKKLPKFTFIFHDIVNPLDIPGNVDEIYNLASPASPKHYQSDGIHTLKTNVYGICNLLDLAHLKKAKLLQFSTSEIYGDPLVHPQTEKYCGNVNTFGPRACYDEGKRCAEAFCFEYHKMRQVAVKIVRIFNTYGPYMDPDDGRVVSNFICQALNGEDITIYGDGSQTRSFCYIDDLLEGLISFMDTPREVTGPINMGNPGEFTVKELAEIVIELTDSKSKIVYHALPQDDPKLRKPDIALARETLGWEPKIPLREGITKTISYYRELSP